MANQTILWRGIYLPGHEACRVISASDGWGLEGVAVFSHDHRACRLAYSVLCDSHWNTLSGSVWGWLGDETVDIELAIDPDHRWRLNGVAQPSVADCIDLDLNFSPSTNLLPIRRLNLAVGDEAQVRAAWLRFPSFELEPLFQTYRRIDESTYRYLSSTGFAADLEVSSVGFVTNYPGIWEVEA